MRHTSGMAAPSWRHRNYRLNGKRFIIKHNNKFTVNALAASILSAGSFVDDKRTT